SAGRRYGQHGERRQGGSDRFPVFDFLLERQALREPRARGGIVPPAPGERGQVLERKAHVALAADSAADLEVFLETGGRFQFVTEVGGCETQVAERQAGRAAVSQVAMDRQALFEVRTRPPGVTLVARGASQVVE